MDIKKITIAAGIFPPDIGGPAIYVVKFGNALVDKGGDAQVVCYSDTKHVTCNTKQDGFLVYRVLRKGNAFLRYFKYFLKLMSVSRSSNVIYAQGPISAGLPAMFVAKILRKKFMVKVVGDPAWEQAMGRGLTTDMIDEFQSKKYGGRIERLKWIRSYVCKRADKIIVPSRYLGRIVASWDVDSSRVEVVYNAIDGTTHDTHNMIQNANNEDIILSVGRLVKWKGFDTLIEIMPELLKENPKFKLVILGDGPEMASLKLKVKSMPRVAPRGQKLDDVVELAGSVGHDKVLEYLKSSMMFVLNTGYEGLSHLILQAMQMKCPVITTNVGGNSEVINNGENGILVEYNNKVQLTAAILRMWRDGGLKAKLTEQAQKDLDKFSFERMIEETEAALTGLIR